MKNETNTLENNINDRSTVSNLNNEPMEWIQHQNSQFVNRYGVSLKKTIKVKIPEYKIKRDGVMNIDPKVNEPHEQIPRRISREQMIEKIRNQYLSVKIDELLKDHEIDFSDSSVNKSVFDLSHFDNKNYDIYPNEYWLNKAIDENNRQLKLQATCLFYNNASKSGAWKKVLISSYDKVTDTFSGHTDDKNKIPFEKIHKIFIIFDVENPYIFCKRIIEALKLRDYSESRIKYIYYLSKIPVDENNSLPEVRMKNITSKVKSLKDLGLVQKEADNEINLINASYMYTINKMIFDDLYFIKKCPDLCSISLKITPEKKKEINFYGKQKISSENYNFSDLNKALSIKYLLCKRHVVEAVAQIKKRTNLMVNNLYLFYTKITNTMKLEEFKTKQRKTIANFKQLIEQDEIGEIKKILKKLEKKEISRQERDIKKFKKEKETKSCINIDEKINPFEIDFIDQKISDKKKKKTFAEEGKKEMYMEVVISKINDYKTKNLINMINLMLKDSLYFLICKSLIQYITFFENLIPSNVEIENTFTVRNIYDNNPIIFPKIDDISKKKNSSNFKLVEDLNNTIDILDAEKITRRVEEDNSKFAIFHITLKYKENQFYYNYNVEDVVNDIKKIFDEGLDKIQKISIISLNESNDYIFKVKNFDILRREKSTESFSKEENQIWVAELYDRLGNSLIMAKEPLNNFLKLFEPFMEYLNINPDNHVKLFEDDNSSADPNLVIKIREDILKHKKLKDNYASLIPKEIQVSFFLVNCKEIRDDMITKFEKIIELEIDLLLKYSRKLKTSINSQCDVLKKEILKPSKTINELVTIERYIDDIPMLLENIKIDIDSCMSIYKILDEFFYKVQFLDLRQRYMLLGAPTEIFNTIYGVKSGILKQRDRFLEELLENQRKLAEEILNVDKKTQELKNYDSLNSLQEATQLARILESTYQDCKDKVNLYNNREAFFNREPTNYSKLLIMYKEFEPFYQIWTNIDTFLNKKQFYLNQKFSSLKGEELKAMNDNVLKYLTTSIRKLKEKDNKYSKIIEMAEEIRKNSEDFKPFVNLACSLTNEGMNIPRHWEKLKQETGIDCTNQDQLTLDNILNTVSITNEIIKKTEQISEKAFKEHNIFLQLQKLETRWADVNFVLLPYRTGDTCTIGGWNDIYTVLDEDVLEVQQLELSQFKGYFLDDISNWTNSLLNITNILEVWKRFQQKWLQLQPIFESSDINKSIPHEAKKFMNASKNWKELIKSLRENTNVKQICTKENLFNQIYDSNILLEEVERGLNDYIEKKKGVFPRFYFISNEDLIEIISQTKDLNKIKENLKKIFENIHYIKLKDEKIITEMLSNLQESVSLKEVVVLQGKNVEVWMKELECSMFITVRQCMDKAIHSYLKTSKEKWLFDHPGQCIIHASQLHWTSEVESSLEKNEIINYINVIQDKINFLVKIVRGKLTRVNSITISNLITLEVHNKDVTQSLVDNECNDIFSFEWIKQMRYYWEKNDCIVKSIQTSFPYGYEYLGNTEILVITPLTDKCYLTLMGALKFNMGGAPAGPAGTGKTESTKDLAKAIAKQCIVYNCSEETDYNTVAKFFKGLACCGAWICFDEFNRINIEVLSVIAQQLIYLFSQKEQSLKSSIPIEIVFEKSTIQILPTFCVFITMNPDYEGRTALPDNLIALFRPMAMMVPDYKLIAQVYLYSCGYYMARDLSKKIVSTFKLSSEQLSNQSHYDFGMRAVKSVLYAAKKLKRSFPDIPEDKLLLRALEDVNVPKFLSEDIPLFQAIIKDLFPTTERPKSDLDDLINKLKENCTKDNIQPSENFLKKVLQLYDTIQVRHGLMIVGPTGGGKSTNWKVLKSAVSDLSAIFPEKYFNTSTVIINPKSIRKEQLFCEKDMNTMEYVNGILPINVIKINQDTGCNTKYWILFDGPVDTLWIEDMNSVLDESRKLCLSSSAIIVLNENITMIFEVEDLTHASPATVSRCGMVFMEPSALGLMPLAISWINNIPSNLLKSSFDFKGKLKELFDVLLEDNINFTRKKLKEPCPSTNNNLAESLMRILDCFLDKYAEKEKEGNTSTKISDLDIELLYKSLPQIYFFATIWSIGITCKEDGRIKFDKYIRQQIESKYPDSVLPSDGSVYDYVFDVENGIWNKWELNYPTIDSRAIYTDIIIPTIDSVRYSYLIKMLVMNNNHLITTGPTGTGKTVNMMDMLAKSALEKIVSLVLNFSAQTTALQTQDTIDSKLTPKTRTTKGPKEKKMIIFVDDLNMPKKEKYEAQPPIEILRQWLDYGGWYDHQDKERQFKWIVNIMFVGAMGLPGGGRSYLSNRFMRHFNLITYTELIDESIKMIFERKVNHFLNRFNEKVKEIVPLLISSTLNLYKEIKSTLLPIPKSSHYLFNLRDMSKVFQGVCTTSMKYTNTKLDIVKLWVHEMTRSFSDRLISDEDRKWLKDLIDNKVTCVEEFDIGDAGLIYQNVDRLIFCDFVVNNDRSYVQVTNIKQFITKIEDYLLNYNEDSKGKPMHLVMFLNACDHVARICRIIRQEQGHALLLGVGGSGRQSLARLGAYINEMECSQIEVFKGYKIDDFKKNIKECLISSGVSLKQTCFLICDTQIFNEQMLEDLNNCLNSGDIPEIYNLDDLETIKNACKSDCAKRGLSETSTNIFSVYLQRVRANIHILMAMSPVGEMFVTRLRMFPSLVNCCTIDWFTEWPDEALQSVAKDSLERNESNNLGLASYLENCINTIKFIHKFVENQSTKYLLELRRYNYLTPTSFLEFLSLFQNILKEKRFQNISNTDRISNGLKVLEFAGEKIEEIEREIKIKTPILEETTIKVAEFIEVLKVNKVEADLVRAEATEERSKAELLNKQITDLDKTCTEQLDKVSSELKISLKKIEEIDPNDLRMVANWQVLSKKAEKVVELLCIFKWGDEFRTHPANLVQTGDLKNPYKLSLLIAMRNLIGKEISKFLGYFQSFINEDVQENLKQKEIHKVWMARDFIETHGITNEYVAAAAGCIVSVFEFIKAMIEFCDKSINVVDPLKKEAAIARVDKIKADQALKIAEEKLFIAEETANKLEKQYNEQQKLKNDLAFEISENTTKMERAKSIVKLLSSEKLRWADNVESLKVLSKNLIGDSLIAAAMIAYSGAFTSEYRSKFEEKFREKLNLEEIPCSEDVSLRQVMEDKLETRKWNINQLPNDNLSIENGIIMFRTRKWPLMIDPQNQACTFLKKYGPSHREACFSCLKASDLKMIEQIQTGVKFGNWILLDNVGINLDSSLEPILLQQKIKRGNYYEIKMGDKIIPYNDEFKLFMITTISNPHYSPETFAKITIINFAITPIGLEEQMLSELVRIEMPELEENKNKILEDNFRSHESLKKIEDAILDILVKNRDNIEEILKTSNLIDILTESKIKSSEINEKIIESEKTGKEIDRKREIYRPNALRSSILFFILLDLSYIDPMYQYSLMQFKKLFNETVRNLSPSDDINQRIIDINKKFSKEFYYYTCRSLFEKDKGLFSFVMSFKILMGEERNLINNSGASITSQELRFLLAGPSGDAEIKYPDNPTKWISNNDWKTFYNQLYGMTRLHQSLADIEKFFMKNHNSFKSFYESPKNEDTPLPEPYESSLKPFLKLIMIKALRFDKLINSITFFIEKNHGKDFIEPPPFDLNKSYKDSTPTIPLLFVLSTGSDPKNDFQQLADSYGRKLDYVSLGKSMDNYAISKIDDMKIKGGWVLLQNCHLAISFMPKLEDKIEKLQNDDSVDPNFRLWLTSMSSNKFSINVLKNSIKITMEPPKGLKLNLLRQYNNVKEEDLENCTKPELFKTLFFSICFFHAIVQDRRKFGSIGWNVKYDFTNEDLKVSRLQLKNFLEEYEEVPYKVLNYLGAEINYGGRVTDDKDQRLIKTILNSFLTPEILKYEGYKFSDSGTYYCPNPTSKKNYIDFIKLLPPTTSPEVFGIHDNAEIITSQNEAFVLLETVLGMQPRTQSSMGKSSDEVVSEILNIVELNTPFAFDIESVKESYKTLYEESMNTVLVQEVYRYNALLIIMKKQIKNLKKALSGRIVMTEEIDKIYGSLYNNQVPQVWIKVGFLSLKPLMSWIADLKERIDFFDNWIKNGTPKAFCLSSNILLFYF